MNDATKVVCYTQPEHIERWNHDPDIGLASYGESFGKYTVPLVTHNDYRALEEQSAYFRKEWNKAEGKITSLEEELASIKARVVELVEAAENTLAVEKRYGLGGSASDRLSSALEAFK